VRAPSASFRHDGTTIIIDFWSERVHVPSASFRHDGTTIIIDFFIFFEKNEKCLELPDLARKLIRIVC
jgi:hypothetical protein